MCVSAPLAAAAGRLVPPHRFQAFEVVTAERGHSTAILYISSVCEPEINTRMRKEILIREHYGISRHR